MVKPKQSDIKKAAQAFVAEWKNRGKEDKDYVEFWEDLLEDVFGVPKARKEIEPQSPVKFEGTTKRIDIRVKTSKVIIEQKSRDVSLDEKLKQIYYIDRAVLSGLSAGAICWFSCGHSDSSIFTFVSY